VEYNLAKSSVRTGVKISENGALRIELTARPTAMVWHPHIGEDIEDRFIVANDEFKLKEFNADSKQCRRTSIAPTFGNPPNKLIALPASDSGNNRYVYSTAERIVGVGCIPLTGNPTEVMGIVAHPGRISCACVSHDGKFMFTGGGLDLTSGMFAIDGGALTPDANGNDMVPYLELLDGGNGGELHNDIVDYFYLCQLRNQGENAMEARDVSGEYCLLDCCKNAH
jgi:cilia- and flagella-associated protein 251